MFPCQNKLLKGNLILEGLLGFVQKFLTAADKALMKLC